MLPKKQTKNARRHHILATSVPDYTPTEEVLNTAKWMPLRHLYYQRLLFLAHACFYDAYLPHFMIYLPGADPGLVRVVRSNPLN